MRLGVVARTAIVASCFWMVGGTFFIAKNIDDKARATATAYYNDCTKLALEGYDCWASREEIYQAHTGKLAGGLWGFAASQAAIYLALCLIAFVAVYSSVRWVLTGRKAR